MTSFLLSHSINKFVTNAVSIDRVPELFSKGCSPMKKQGSIHGRRRRHGVGTLLESAVVSGMSTDNTSVPFKR